MNISRSKHRGQWWLGKHRVTSAASDATGARAGADNDMSHCQLDVSAAPLLHEAPDVDHDPPAYDLPAYDLPARDLPADQVSDAFASLSIRYADEFLSTDEEGSNSHATS